VSPNVHPIQLLHFQTHTTSTPTQSFTITSIFSSILINPSHHKRPIKKPITHYVHLQSCTTYKRKTCINSALWQLIPFFWHKSAFRLVTITTASPESDHQDQPCLLTPFPHHKKSRAFANKDRIFVICFQYMVESHMPRQLGWRAGSRPHQIYRKGKRSFDTFQHPWSLD